MPIIDAHVHLYPPEVNRDPAAWASACGENHWATLCTRKRKDGQPVQGFPGVDALLREMDAAGVERAVLLGWYWERPETCRMQNKYYAECVQAHPDRLSAFASIHPGAGLEQTLGEIWLAQDSGLIGLGELSPHSQGFGVGDPVFQAAIERAGKQGLPVNLHVTDPKSTGYPGRVETPLADFIRLAREYPATKFILAHWGGGLAFDSENRPLKNLYYDSAASPLLYGREVWRQAADAVGAERILFGSDNPLRLYPKTEAGTGLTAFVREAKAALSAKEIDFVLGGAAAKLLNLR